jgi:hypothetical protein
MNSTSHTIRRTLQALAVTAAIAAVAAPAAGAVGRGSDAGIVPSKLGSPDPRESNTKVFSAGLVPSRLGSQDPRDSAAASFGSQASIVARQLGSQDPRDTAAASFGSQASIVARQLGSQDPRDTASQVLAESSIVARDLGTPDTGSRNDTTSIVRGGVVNQATDENRDWSNLGIGIVVAACGLLLLTALGIGARQARHARHRLGSA